MVISRIPREVRFGRKHMPGSDGTGYSETRPNYLKRCYILDHTAFRCTEHHVRSPSCRFLEPISLRRSIAPSTTTGPAICPAVGAYSAAGRDVRIVHRWFL